MKKKFKGFKLHSTFNGHEKAVKERLESKSEGCATIKIYVLDGKVHQSSYGWKDGSFTRGKV